MGVPYAEVIGDPVAHSKSPSIHNFWLRRLGIEGSYRRTRVTREELGGLLERRRADEDWRGCNVTIPHKIAIMPLLDECRLYDVAAVNCVVREGRRLIGYNTDMDGVGRALPEFVDTDAPICIIGAGGAARGAVGLLDVLAVFQFNVIARDPEKAQALIAPYAEYGRVFGFDSARLAIRDCVGLINATPLGMDGFDPMPETVTASLSELDTRAFVIDMVYAPVRTELLRRAAALGFYAADGLTVLIGQAEAAFAHFFGSPPPAYDVAELRALLTS
jgi:shikimate dehydrogenase